MAKQYMDPEIENYYELHVEDNFELTIENFTKILGEDRITKINDKKYLIDTAMEYAHGAHKGEFPVMLFIIQKDDGVYLYDEAKNMRMCYDGIENLSSAGQKILEKILKANNVKMDEYGGFWVKLSVSYEKSQLADMLAVLLSLSFIGELNK